MTLTASPRPISCAGANAMSASRIPGSWTPMSRKANPLMRKMSTGQTPVPISLPLGDKTRAACRPATIPAVTTARTPLTWSVSAGR